MPTVAQVLSRAQPPAAGRWYTGTVTAVTPGTGVTVRVDGDPGAVVTGFRLNSDTYAAGQRVLVLRIPTAAFILGRITP